VAAVDSAPAAGTIDQRLNRIRRAAALAVLS
jgi:hypothetical protein